MMTPGWFKASSFVRGATSLAIHASGFQICKKILSLENALNKYNERDERIGEQVDGNRNRGEIVADITTSFIILLGIFFPSCTGNFLQP